MSPANLDRLRSIKTLPQLVAYLRDVLDWPIESSDTDEITFDYEPSELGLDAKTAVRIKEIKQLRPLASGQPWGIFFINFEKKSLPVVAMRRILRALALRKRESANKAERQAWQTEDLLFISAYGEDSDRALTFAHFVDSPSLNLAELRVLGWDDDDTPLKLDYVVRTLGEKLRWQDEFADDPKKWRAQWADAFRIRHGHVIRTSAELAGALAILARRIRARVSKILEMEAGTGEIRTLQRAFRIGLIHDLDDAAFADMFAQTITYGLFSLACRRTIPGMGTAFVKDDLSHYFTSPFLKEMLGVFLGIKSRKGRIDFDELGISDVTDLLTSKDTHMEVVLAEFGNKTRGEDPVIHFYEHFLTAYNKQLKIQRGVFYTPQPVVSYIVRSVHELLQTEFGLADGLADTTTWGEMLKKHPGLKLPPLTDEPGEKRTVSPDEPFVQILDPATGTATFLVEVIDVIHRHLEAKWKSGTGILPVISGKHGRDARATFKAFSAYWNAYVPAALLPRLHAFELMMAPYAIAHMKVGLKLTETGYQFAADERARIYLTNALEPKVSQLPQLGFDALAREAEEVNEIKWYKRFTVVMGNPPYSTISQNMRGWISDLVNEYLQLPDGPMREKINRNHLQDDYVKFIRLAQVVVEHTRFGLVGMITNNSYYSGNWHRGMRYNLSNAFARIRLVNLHGGKGFLRSASEADENVFDIMQSVGLAFLVRGFRDSRSVAYHEIVGSRDEKYERLAKSDAGDEIALTPSEGNQWLFQPLSSELQPEWNTCVSIDRVFAEWGAGVKTNRDGLATGFNRHEVESQIRAFADLEIADGKVEETYSFKSNYQWKTGAVRKNFSREGFKSALVEHYSHRPFDVRFVYWHSAVVFNMRGGKMECFRSASPPVALLFARNTTKEAYTNFFVTRWITDIHCLETMNVAPLFAGSAELGGIDSLNLSIAAQSNFSRPFLTEFATRLNLPIVQPHGLPAGLTPEDIFHYAYAVFHSPGYRSRYAEFLKIDFPRLPLTGNLELFRALARLGGELVALHLLEFEVGTPLRGVRGTTDSSESRPYQQSTEWIGGRNPEVEKISWSKNTVWVDKAQTAGFRGVREAVWNFHIGGYQVCEKWLKDRKGRTLTKDDLAHYHKIVIALSETIRLMADIDKVIEKHGGWPGAFAHSASASTPPSPVRGEHLAYAAEEQAPYGERTDRSPTNALPKAPKPDLGLRTEDELPLA